MGTAFGAGLVQLKLDHRAGAEFERELDHLFDAIDSRQARAQAIGHQISFRAMCVVLSGVGVAIFASEGGIGLPAQMGYELAALIQLSISPVFQVVRALPPLRNANAAADNLMTEIERFGVAPAASGPNRPATSPRVRCERLEYIYPAAPGASGFAVGPLDLDLEPGTLVFVTGGNGSGKTTLMKLLTGLYAPHRGTIRVDGRPVTPAGRQAYRDHFTTIFGPPFLFDRPYGLDASPDDIVALLDRFGITDMVGFDGERFGALDLSSGQAMRLAMVVALLEERPICVFDEWTANQDPQMTRYYYEVLLPELVEAGRTVIAVSHDDRFFHLADLHVRLDRGQVEIARGPGGHRR